VRVAALSAGGRHVCAVAAADGRVVCAGDDGGGGGAVRGAPRDGGWAAVSCAGRACCALPASGAAATACWGSAPASLFAPPAAPLAQVSVGAAGWACGVTRGADAVVLCWGALAAPAAPRTVLAAPARASAGGRAARAAAAALAAAAHAGGPPVNATYARAERAPYTQVSVGRDFACALTADGALDCFGGGPLPELARARLPADALVLEVAAAPDALCVVYALTAAAAATAAAANSSGGGGGSSDAGAPAPMLDCWAAAAAHDAALAPPDGLRPALLL
jgi:hypothetical protein